MNKKRSVCNTKNSTTNDINSRGFAVYFQKMGDVYKSTYFRRVLIIPKSI